MSPVTGDTDALFVVGVSAKVSNEDPSGISSLWERYYSTNVADRVPIKLSDEVIAVYHAYEGDHRAPFQMTIGHRVSAHTYPSPELVIVTVPAQPVLIYDATGLQPGALIATWQKIWESEIARAFIADVEIHDGKDPHKVAINVGLKR